MGNELIYYPSSVLETDSTPELLAGADDSPNNDLILDVTTNYLLLAVTEQQYSRMLSALFNGAYLAYPLDYIDVVYPLIKAGKVTLCDAILDCVLDTEELQQAIAFYSNSSAITDTTPENQIILDTDLFQSQGPCDNDEIYGMTVQLTAFLNVVSEDILEIFVTAFAAPGRLGDIIEAIPGVGLLPFDDIAQFLEKVAEQVNDAYQAAYDTQIAEDISCALFCIAQDTCSLTLEQARDWFQDQLTETVSNADFLTVVNDIIANNWLGEQSIYVMNWLILDTIIFGGEMLGVDVNRLKTTIASYFNDPNSDWSTLCTACVWHVDWLAGDGDPVDDGWVLEHGTYEIADERLENTGITGSTDGVVVNYEFPAGKTGNLTKISFNYDILACGTNRTIRIQVWDELSQLVIDESQSQGTGSGVFEWTGTEIFEEDYIMEIRCVVANNCTPFHGWITDMIVEGSGDNPFT